MAVEIRELIIRAVVAEGEESSEESQPGTPTNDDKDKEAIIEACVRQVLRILNKSRER